MTKKSEVSKWSNINLRVGLDEKNVPVIIFWSSDDDPKNRKESECKAFLLSMFDKEHKDTLKIDLWTTELQVVEMDRLMFQTLRTLVDTYFKATGNQPLANEMQKFVHYFGQQTEIIPKS
ncbi:MAG: gliding motility protein GldC [Bacteroidota bacterium]